MLGTKDINQSMVSLGSSSSTNRISRKSNNFFHRTMIHKPKSKEKLQTSFQQYCIKELNTNQKYNKTPINASNFPSQFSPSHDNPENNFESPKNVCPSRENIYSRLISQGDQRKVIERHKKRSPTPARSHKQMVEPELTKLSSEKDDKMMEYEATIAGLEITISSQTQAREKLQESNMKIWKQVNDCKATISILNQENKLLKNNNLEQEAKNNQLTQKNKEMQKLISQNQNHLAIATKNLYKLRQTIKESRIQELQFETQRMNRVIDSLNEEIRILKQQNSILQENNNQVQEEMILLKLDVNDSQSQPQREKYLQQEILRLKEFIKLEENEKEKLLEYNLNKKEETIIRISHQFESQRRRRHFLQYKLQHQITQLKEKNDCEIKAIRVRYSKMMSNMKEKCRKLGGQVDSPIKRHGIMQNRANRSLLHKIQVPHEEEIKFQLSPQ